MIQGSYTPESFESKWYAIWEKNNSFKPKKEKIDITKLGIYFDHLNDIFEEIYTILYPRLK